MAKKNAEPRKNKPTKRKSSAQKKAAKQRKPRWVQNELSPVKKRVKSKKELPLGGFFYGGESFQEYLAVYS